MSDSEDDEGQKDRQLKITLIGDGTAGKVILRLPDNLSLALQYTLFYSSTFFLLCTSNAGYLQAFCAAVLVRYIFHSICRRYLRVECLKI